MSADGGDLDVVEDEHSLIGSCVKELQKACIDDSTVNNELVVIEPESCGISSCQHSADCRSDVTDKFITRESDNEHQLILQYVTDINTQTPVENMTADECKSDELCQAQLQQEQILEQHTRKNQELRIKLNNMKEILQLESDITDIEQRLLLEQEKRSSLTQSRDELMKLLKERYRLWSSPTMSQATSEQSVDESCLASPTTESQLLLNMINDYSLSLNASIELQSETEVKEVQQHL